MVYSRRIIEAKQNLGASFNIKAKARELRETMTVAEKILWNKLRRRQLNGKYFRRQHPYNIYILDFYCFEANLVIEVDGEIHLKRRIYDEERTKFLNSSGAKVLRFSNHEIETKLDWVIERINENLIQCYPLPNLPPRGQEAEESLSPLGETGKGV